MKYQSIWKMKIRVLHNIDISQRTHIYKGLRFTAFPKFWPSTILRLGGIQKPCGFIFGIFWHCVVTRLETHFEWAVNPRGLIWQTKTFFGPICETFIMLGELFLCPKNHCSYGNYQVRWDGLAFPCTPNPAVSRNHTPGPPWPRLQTRCSPLLLKK